MNLPRTFVLTVDRPIKRFDECVAHLDAMGIKWERFNGVDNTVMKLLPVETFDMDRVGEKIGSKHICACLTHYLCWKVCSYLPDDSFWILEYDVYFPEGWRARYEEAMSVMPDDWDIIMLGSCCCAGREKKHIGKNVYEVFWPLCGHATAVRAKALPTLLKNHQRISMPLDIALFHWTFPKLRVYTILEPLILQAGTPLPP